NNGYVNHNNNFVNNGNRNNVNGGNRNNINNGNRGNGNRGNSNWQHNPKHRGGAPYGDRGTANKFGGTTRGDSMANRQANARQNQARQQPAGGMGNRGTSPGAGNRDMANRGTGPGAGNRDMGNRGAGAGNAGG